MFVEQTSPNHLLFICKYMNCNYFVKRTLTLVVGAGATHVEMLLYQSLVKKLWRSEESGNLLGLGATNHPIS